jgi:hypothetical protein
MTHFKYAGVAAFSLAFALIAAPWSASAATPIQWNISNATFDDGGQLYGTFTTDIISGSLSVLDFDITTTAGSHPNGYGIMRSGYEYKFSDLAAPYPKVVASPGIFFGVGSELSSLHFAYISEAGTEFYLTMLFTYNLDSAHLNNSLFVFGNGAVYTWECTNCGDLRTISSAGTLGVTGHEIGVTTPVPEPETYAMLLAGLGLLGFAARRRKLREAVAA